MRPAAFALVSLAWLGACGGSQSPAPTKQHESTPVVDGPTEPRRSTDGPGSSGASSPPATNGEPPAVALIEGLTPPAIEGKLMAIWPHAVVLSITPEKVMLADEELARLDGEAVAPVDATAQIVPPLKKAIVDGAAELGRRVPALVLVVDQEVTHDNLAAILEYGAEAGFRAFGLAASSGGELGQIVLDPMLVQGLDEQLGTATVPVITVHDDALVFGKDGDRLETPTAGWPRDQVAARAAKLVPAAPATPRVALMPDAGTTYGQVMRTMDAIKSSLPLLILLEPEATVVPYASAYEAAMVPRESALEQVLPE